MSNRLARGSMPWPGLPTPDQPRSKGSSETDEINMACIANLSPSHRPPQPSLNNGPVQRRVRRAFVATGQSVLSTTLIMDWSHPRPGTNRHHARRSVRRVCERYCERVGRGTSIGRPLLWRLRNTADD